MDRLTVLTSHHHYCHSRYDYPRNSYYISATRSSVLLLLLAFLRGNLDSVEASLLHHDDYHISTAQPPVTLPYHCIGDGDGADENDVDGDNDDDNEGCSLPSLP